MNDKKLSYSLRIEDANGIHTSASMFTGMIPVEQDHAKATRGLAGKFTMRADEFDAFVLQTRPHIITFPPEKSVIGIQAIVQYISNEVTAMYEFQPRQGTWDYPKWVLREDAL